MSTPVRRVLVQGIIDIIDKHHMLWPRDLVLTVSRQVDDPVDDIIWHGVQNPVRDHIANLRRR